MEPSAVVCTSALRSKSCLVLGKSKLGQAVTRPRFEPGTIQTQSDDYRRHLGRKRVLFSKNPTCAESVDCLRRLLYSQNQLRRNGKEYRMTQKVLHTSCLTFGQRNYFFNFSTPCI